MESYKYNSLDEEKLRFPFSLWDDRRPFRLVHILPGDFDVELTLEIVTRYITRSSTSRQRYQALSYAWGSEHNKSSVNIKTDSGLKCLKVTQNLAYALRHFRSLHAPTTMWIDAICINQDDDSEKNEQVSMMGEIYGMADCVKVWLGPELDDSSLALKTLQEFADNVLRLDWSHQTIIYKEGFDPASIILDAQSAKALSRLVWRDWFERIWVLQEIYLAKEVYVCCGLSTISWKQFQNGFRMTGEENIASAIRRAVGSDHKNYDSREASILRLIHGARPQFSYLRNFIGFFLCKDPKDRIYGVLGFLEVGALPASFRPNYALSMRDAYRAAVIQHIYHVNALDILASCELRHPDPSSDLPSWVPDFRLPLLPPALTASVAKASSFLPAQFSVKGDILDVCAVRVTTVETTHPMLRGSTHTMTEEEFENLINSAWESLKSGNCTFSISDQDHVGVFCSALCGGIFQHTYIPPRSIDLAFDDCRRVLTRILGFRSDASAGLPTKDNASLSNEAYTSAARKSCHNRTLISTDRGYIGLAPLSVQSGDEIFIVFGCERPLVFRPVSKNKYQVVGETIMPQIHAGEPALGPLPEDMVLVNHYYEPKNYWYGGFWSSKDQQVVRKDPRIKHDKPWDQLLISLLGPRYGLQNEFNVDVRTISLI